MHTRAPPALSTRRISLVQHPQSQSPAGITNVEVHCDWHADGISLHYRISPVAELRIPAPRPAVQVDGLWRHTCMEAFLAARDSEGYHEYNFSPSGEWARYCFSAERVRDLETEHLAQPWRPRIDSHTMGGRLHLSVRVPISDFPISTEGWWLGVNSVLEDRHGNLTYWALTHPCQAPDFHHPGGRIWRLPLE